MTDKYQIMIETGDGTCDFFMDGGNSKAKAIKTARTVAKTTALPDAVRVWVDRDDMGIVSFPVGG